MVIQKAGIALAEYLVHQGEVSIVAVNPRHSQDPRRVWLTFSKGRFMHNADVAQGFEESRISWRSKPRILFWLHAYRTAARTLRDLPREITAMLEQKEDLNALPGIGQSLPIFQPCPQERAFKDVVETLKPICAHHEPTAVAG